MEKRYWNPWLVTGPMLPNWLLIRPEISLGAKVIWSIIRDDVTTPLPDGSKRDPVYLGSYEGLEQYLAGNATRSQIKKWISELEKYGLLFTVELDGFDGFCLQYREDWADPTFTKKANGAHKYRSQKPGQWWMNSEEDLPEDTEDK